MKQIGGRTTMKQRNGSHREHLYIRASNPTLKFAPFGRWDAPANKVKGKKSKAKFAPFGRWDAPAVLGDTKSPIFKFAPFGRWDAPAARPLAPRWASQTEPL